MDSLAVFLLLSNMIFFSSVILASSLSRRGLEVNHETLFGIGLLFYWIFPIIVGFFKLYLGAPGLDWWHSIFRQIDSGQLNLYLGCTLFIGSAFYLGSRFGRRPLKELRQLATNLTFDRRFLIFYLGLALVPACYYIYSFRGILFTGYRELSWTESSQKGAFVATSSLVLGIAWLHVLRRRLGRGLTLFQTFFNPYTGLYMVLSVLIVSLGGRLYFASAVMMFTVFYTLHFRRLGLAKSFLGLVIFVSLIGLLGVWREGSDFSVARAAFIIAAEPIYTSFSLLSYLADNSLNLINAPIFLFSSFVGLVPTLLYPNKRELFLNPTDYGFEWISPVGAMNSFVSLDINFGILGGVLLFFVFGFVLAQLKAQRHSVATQVVYIMTCGFLPFTFFRDPYATSLVKNWFQFSLFTPLLLIFFLHLLTAAAQRRRNLSYED